MDSDNSTGPINRTAGWAALNDLVVVSFKGTAARAFLGRQLTCDLARLAPDAPQLGAWLTAKGRVLALLRLIDRGADTIDAIVPSTLADDLMARMRLFVMRDDVTIAIETQYRILGVWGSCVTSAMQALQGANSHCVLTLVNDQPPLALVSGPASAIDVLINELSAPEGSSLHWQRLNIEAGLPQIDADAREAFIPQMINLDRIDGVSFTKGCYPGQEIVARTQHLGRIKRRMFITRVEHGGTLHAGDIKPGDVIVGADGEDIGGRVVNVDIGDRDAVMLSVLPLHSDEQQAQSGATVRLHDARGLSLQISAPPYPLTDPAN